MDPRYSQIHSQLWGDEKFAALSEGDKLLFLYLLTSPHCNMVGYYRLPLAYAAADLGWDAQKVADGLTRLAPMVVYDRAASVVLIRHYLEYNPVKSPSQVTGALKQIKAVPKNCLWSEFVVAAKQYAMELARNLDTLCDTLATPYQQGIGTVPTGFRTSPVQSCPNQTDIDTPPTPPPVDNSEDLGAQGPKGDAFSDLMRTVGDRDIDLDFEAAVAMERDITRHQIPLRVVE
ncbi:MAG TPA: hypothetical protein GXX28_08600, partial [Firmicutes bacterium]|nr:hypothetical protein [Bacillota bacterium]